MISILMTFGEILVSDIIGDGHVSLSSSLETSFLFTNPNSWRGFYFFFQH